MSDNAVLSRQEMFNRAVRGLASQGFERCGERTVDEDFACAYELNGRHCAWGWVDTNLVGKSPGVRSLRDKGVGVAATLSNVDMDFAVALQRTHDRSPGPSGMQMALQVLASKWDLVWPGDVAQ